MSVPLFSTLCAWTQPRTTKNLNIIFLIAHHTLNPFTDRFAHAEWRDERTTCQMPTFSFVNLEKRETLVRIFVAEKHSKLELEFFHWVFFLSSLFLAFFFSLFPYAIIIAINIKIILPPTTKFDYRNCHYIMHLWLARAWTCFTASSHPQTAPRIWNTLLLLWLGVEAHKPTTLQHEIFVGCTDNADNDNIDWFNWQCTREARVELGRDAGPVCSDSGGWSRERSTAIERQRTASGRADTAGTDQRQSPAINCRRNYITAILEWIVANVARWWR